ncbi:MAG: elongation factor P [Candidatus Omnitrophota bacterium]|jgi:elongation factor P|nr:MAG: elongation factor P [Candidatus Omnitrophota bacterium]
MGITIKPTDVRVGTNLEFDGEVYICTKYEHVSPGKGQAFIRIKVKHIKSGRVLEKTIKSNDKCECAVLEPKQVQYMYRDDQLHFMDHSTYEQFSLAPDALLGKDVWLKDNTDITLLFFNGEPVDVDIPAHMELEVTETEPGIKGDTASGGSKPATLETGVVVQVPLFISIGDVVKVDTRDGTYVVRV